MKKTYSDSTPHVALSYDAAGYGKGKLSKVETKSLASLGGFVRTVVSCDSYDALGRILGHTQSVAVSTPPDAAGPIPSVQPAMRTYLFEYRYHLAGMTYMKYPSGRVVEYEVDQTSGRQTAVKATSGTPTYYAKQISYWPSGAMKQLRYETKVATGAPPEIWEERCYNGRNQMTTLRIRDLQSPGCARAASDQFFQGYGYGPAPLNSGNVRGGTIWRGANLWSQTYGYDSRNRLLSVNETAGTAANPPLSYKQTFAYDAVGNRAMDSTASPADYFPDGATYAPYAAPADIPAIFPNNQWTGAKYDNSGNLTEILTTTRAYAYDGESRMVKASGPKIAGYEYDGLGRRIRKNVEGSGEHWIYVYAADGSLAAEYPEVGGLPLTGRRYVVGDMLGSTRLTMKEDGSQDECMDYTPFGSELPQSLRTGLTCYPVEPEVKKAAPTGVTEKFTGKERDAETGLDYFGARYMSAAQGRFTSPDAPLVDQHPADPQSWNLYSYVRNNPLRFVDPTGRAATVTSSCSTKDGRTTCDVQISATAAFYAADSETKSGNVQVIASGTKKDAEKAWSGTYTENGVTYNVKTTVEVQIYGSETEALASGAQNVIGVQYNPVDSANDSGVAVAEVSARAPGYSGPDRALFSWATGASARPHEFGHMLGVGHHEGDYLMSPTPTLRGATQSDFGWALGPSLRNQRANEHVNPGLRGRPAVYNLQARPTWWWGR